MKDKIKEIFINLGAEVCGVANIDLFMDAPKGFNAIDIYPDCKSVIVFAKKITRGIAYVSPRIVYQHFNSISAVEVDRIAYLASNEIEKIYKGISVPIPSDGPSDTPVENICIKGCSLCIDNCPVNAINEYGVNQKLCRKCAYSSNDRGFDVVNCNKCRTICPMALGRNKDYEQNII